MPIPQIQIQLTPLIMEYRTTRAKLEIFTEQPKFNVQKRPISFQVEVKQPAKLTIDQSRAFEALGMGGNEFFSKQIYSQSKDIVLQAIAKKVEDGNKMADHKQGSVIPDLHEGEPLTEIPFDYVSEPSYKNVDFNYQPKEIATRIDPGEISMSFQVNPPRSQYTAGRFDAYVKQYNNVKIVPPQIDLQK